MPNSPRVEKCQADELTNLQARVSYLETALHGMWAMLEPLQPPEHQRNIGDLMEKHFLASIRIGGCRSVDFDQPNALPVSGEHD